MSYIDQKEMQLLDASSNVINPGTDDALILLRKLVKNTESLCVQDAAQRQRIAIESIPSVTISYLPAWGGSQLDVRWDMIQWARTAYATGIRSQLTFT